MNKVIEKNENLTERSKRVDVFTPQTNIAENDNSYVLQLELPGVTDENLDISIEKNTLTIEALQDIKEHDGYKPVYQEFSYGKYLRKFLLNEEIDNDNIIAELSQGLLTLTLPRIKPKVQKIKIQTK